MYEIEIFQETLEMNTNAAKYWTGIMSKIVEAACTTWSEENQQQSHN